MTMVPLIVVADNISAFKAMDQRPNFKVFPKFKSTDKSFEKEEKVESRVEAAEVIIIKLMTNRIITPKALPTSTAACPCRPACFA